MALSSLDSQLLLSLVSRLSTYFHFTNLKFFFLLLLVSFQNNVYLHKYMLNYFLKFFICYEKNIGISIFINSFILCC